MRRLDPFLVPLVVATLACLWIVPAFPLAHLDDPGHLAVLAYVLVLFFLFRLRLRGVRGSRSERRLWSLFLAGMPVVYLALWFRFQGDHPWLGNELLAALVFWMFAAWGVRLSPWFLVIGIAGHGLWDVGHYSRLEYVADWYALACFLVDIGVALYLTGQVRFFNRREADEPQISMASA